MNTTQIRTSTHTGTWMGRKGTSTTYRTVRSTTGLRVEVTVWDDAPEVATVRLIEGDGRTDNFTEHCAVTDVPVAQAADIAAEWLA